MSRAQEIKEKDATTRARMVLFLGGDDELVIELISQLGCDWLEKQYDTTRARRCAAHSKEFWAWWRNQWAITDTRLSLLLRVDKTGVMHYTTSADSTTFIHSQGEFRIFYQTHHLLAIKTLTVPAELAARWVATAQLPE
jgi:hypothetical protein